MILLVPQAASSPDAATARPSHGPWPTRPGAGANGRQAVRERYIQQSFNAAIAQIRFEAGGRLHDARYDLAGADKVRAWANWWWPRRCVGWPAPPWRAGRGVPSGHHDRPDRDLPPGQRRLGHRGADLRSRGRRRTASRPELVSGKTSPRAAQNPSAPSPTASTGARIPRRLASRSRSAHDRLTPGIRSARMISSLRPSARTASRTSRHSRSSSRRMLTCTPCAQT
jgi:hypothetical protein